MNDYQIACENIRYEIEQLELHNELDSLIFKLDELLNTSDDIDIIKVNIGEFGITPTLESITGGTMATIGTLKKFGKKALDGIKIVAINILDVIKKIVIGARSRLKTELMKTRELIDTKKGKVNWSKVDNIMMPYSKEYIKYTNDFIVFIKSMMNDILKDKLPKDSFKFYNDLFDLVIDTDKKKIIRWEDNSSKRQVTEEPADRSIFDIDELIKLSDWVIRETERFIDQLKYKVKTETIKEDLIRKSFEVKIYRKSVRWLIDFTLRSLTKYNKVYVKLPIDE